MKRVNVFRWHDGVLTEFEDRIAEGSFLHLRLMDGIALDTVISPNRVKEFVYGNLFSEGLIRTSKDVLSYKERRRENNFVVEVSLASSKKLSFRRNYNVLWTDCASPSLIQKRLGDKLTVIRTSLRIKPRKLIEATRKVRELSVPYKETGALHSAFLFDENLEVITYAHDVSRHNAVDKVIGTHFLGGKSFEDTLLMTTGRITSSMVLKCLRTKVPILVSRGAPLYDSIRLAREYGLCVIGFLRGKRFNVYSGREILSQ